MERHALKMLLQLCALCLAMTMNLSCNRSKSKPTVPKPKGAAEQLVVECATGEKPDNSGGCVKVAECATGEKPDNSGGCVTEVEKFECPDGTFEDFASDCDTAPPIEEPIIIADPNQGTKTGSSNMSDSIFKGGGGLNSSDSLSSPFSLAASQGNQTNYEKFIQNNGGLWNKLKERTTYHGGLSLTDSPKAYNMFNIYELPDALAISKLPENLQGFQYTTQGVTYRVTSHSFINRQPHTGPSGPIGHSRLKVQKYTKEPVLVDIFVPNSYNPSQTYVARFVSNFMPQSKSYPSEDAIVRTQQRADMDKVYIWIKAEKLYFEDAPRIIKELTEVYSIGVGQLNWHTTIDDGQ